LYMMNLCLCVQAKMAMCKTTIDFVSGMLELKLFGFNALLDSVLSDVLREVGSFMPTDNIRYNVSVMLVVWIIFQCCC